MHIEQLEDELASVSRLPNPVAAEWDWQLLAACRGVDTTVFFSPEAERGVRRLARERVAKAVCGTCPVIAACREHAIRVAEPFGVWGGLTPDERRALTAHVSRPSAARVRTA